MHSYYAIAKFGPVHFQRFYDFILSHIHNSTDYAVIYNSTYNLLKCLVINITEMHIIYNFKNDKTTYPQRQQY